MSESEKELIFFSVLYYYFGVLLFLDWKWNIRDYKGLDKYKTVKTHTHKYLVTQSTLVTVVLSDCSSTQPDWVPRKL